MWVATRSAGAYSADSWGPDIGVLFASERTLPTVPGGILSALDARDQGAPYYRKTAVCDRTGSTA